MTSKHLFFSLITVLIAAPALTPFVVAQQAAAPAPPSGSLLRERRERR